MKPTEDFTIAWFSCGITSAVACKLAIETLPNVIPVYLYIDSAHDDNVRFIKDCEKWYGRKIETFMSLKYLNQFDVIQRTGYVNGPSGARCTKELKKEVRYMIEKAFEPDLFSPDKPKILHQIHGFEFDVKQIKRAIDFSIDFPYTNAIYPLIDNRITKGNAAQIVLDAGIRLPKMYELGYNNNNCIGCVKGGMGYWNKIRDDFPDHFDRMAKAERIAGHSCINGTFLDELDPEQGRTPKPIIPSCSVVCEDIFGEEVNLSAAQKVYNGETSVYEAIKSFSSTKD